MTWYRRPPTRPNGTAQMAMSTTSCGLPPRARQRLSPSQTATRIPARMHMAYIRIGIGPRWYWALDGLGMSARYVATWCAAGRLIGGGRPRWWD